MIGLEYRDNRIHIILDLMLRCNIKSSLTQWYILNEFYPEKYHQVYHHRHSCARYSAYHIVFSLLCFNRSHPRFSHGRRLPLFIRSICRHRRCIVSFFGFASCRSFICQGLAIYTAWSLLASLSTPSIFPLNNHNHSIHLDRIILL